MLASKLLSARPARAGAVQVSAVAKPSSGEFSTHHCSVFSLSLSAHGTIRATPRVGLQVDGMFGA